MLKGFAIIALSLLATTALADASSSADPTEAVKAMAEIQRPLLIQTVAAARATIKKLPQASDVLEVDSFLEKIQKNLPSTKFIFRARNKMTSEVPVTDEAGSEF